MQHSPSMLTRYLSGLAVVVCLCALQIGCGEDAAFHPPPADDTSPPTDTSPPDTAPNEPDLIIGTFDPVAYCEGRPQPIEQMYDIHLLAKPCCNANGFTYCEFRSSCCDGACINPRTDQENCGACRNVCSDGEICQDSKCVCGSDGFECEKEQTCCAVYGTLACINPQTDQENCGGCGNVCADDEQCIDGTCTAETPSP